MAILYSGTEGTCQWTIDNQGHLYIGSGVINHNTSNYNDWSWYQYRREITSVSSGNVSWSVGANAYYMFDNFTATSFDLSNFDTSNVISMIGMFSGCNNLTSLDLLSFDTSNVESMTYMFGYCSSLVSLNLSNFDTNKVTNMPWMFIDCSNLTTIIVSDKWTVASVTDSRDMFQYCSSLIGEQETTYNPLHKDASYAHIDGGTSNPGYLTDINSCPCYASFNSDNGELRIFKDVEGKYTEGQVIGSTTYWTNIESITGNNAPPWHENFSQDIESVKIINTYKPKTAYWLFSDCFSLASLDLSNLNTSNATNMSGMFLGCELLTSLDLSNFDTSNVTNMSNMFLDCESLASLDISAFDSSNVTNMSNMFRNCQSLTSLDLLNFDTNKVTDMSYMFYNCQSLTSLNLLNFNTSNVTNMGSMFCYCQSLTSLNLSNFDTSEVENMISMFHSCQSLTSLDLSNFDTSNVTTMGNMFYDCKSFTSLDLSNFDTSNVTNMSFMFAICVNLISLNLPENFASNTVNFNGVFGLDTKLTQLNITKIHLKKVEQLSAAFKKCSFSLNIAIGNVSLVSYTSAFEESTGTFYIIDSTKANTSWQTVASEYNNVFYNVDGAFLPAYKLNAARGSIVDEEWVSDEGGDSICFTYDDGDITSISNIPEGFSCTNDTIVVKENNMPISLTWDNKTSILELQEFSEAHQYVMELTYNFTDEDDNTYTKTVSQLISISEPYALLDFRAGGKGIAIGKLSERNGFDIAFPMSVGKGLIPPGEWSYFLSKDIEVNNSKTYYTYDEQTGEYNEVSNPTTESPVEQGYYEREWLVDLTNYQLLVGNYNTLNENAYMIVGGGSDDEHRRNVLELDTGGLRIYAFNGTKQIAQLGYGPGASSGGGTSNAPFYTIGVRESGSAIGNYSVAEGCNTIASNFGSHAEGTYTVSSGSESHAEGYSTIANKDASHAEGWYTEASGSYSHAENCRTIASGNGSHSEGWYTKAIGNRSHAQNYYTIAASEKQTAIGKYNIPDMITDTFIGDGTTTDFPLSVDPGETGKMLLCTIDGQKGSSFYYDPEIYNGMLTLGKAPGQGIEVVVTYTLEKYAFIVGNGTAENARSNAFMIDWQGNIMAQGMAGMIMMFGGTTAPAGWLICDGNQYLKTEYPELYAAIGDMYGDTSKGWLAPTSGDYFRVPDLRGRFPIGVGNGTASGHTNHALASGSGAEKVTLSAANMPYHRHGIPKLSMSTYDGFKPSLQVCSVTTGSSSTSDNPIIYANESRGTANKNNAYTGASNVGGIHTHTTNANNTDYAGGSNGAATAHENMPPYIGLNFIIATGKTS